MQLSPTQEKLLWVLKEKSQYYGNMGIKEIASLELTETLKRKVESLAVGLGRVIGGAEPGYSGSGTSAGKGVVVSA